MKEAFWGVLIVILGLFGIVVVNIFQNVTVDNDRVYYLIKESTEASAFDALDLTYYRLSGNLRIVEDKFVENLTRRFAESVTIGDYIIVVEDINEMPPKVSLRVRSGITSLRGEEFGIVNRVDAIIETKYSLDEVLDFLDITKDEWDDKTSDIYGDENDNGEKVCNVNDDDELECMPGDIKFVGFEDVTLQNAVCQDETPKQNVERIAKYKVCNCGKWEAEEEKVYANPVRVGNEHIYTWNFVKTGEIRTINETIKGRVPAQICTTNIGIMVPNDIDSKTPNSDGSSHEPSSDNSSYIGCPAGGIRVPVGMKFTVHPNYIPPLSVNRNLEWTVNDSNILGIQSSNPSDSCVLNSSGTNCFSKAIVTAKNVGTTYINVKTTRGQTASCKVDVFDGNVDSVSCENLTLNYGASGVMKRSYTPKNATKTNFTWSISNSNIATINASSGAVTAKSSGSATVTIKAPNGKTGTCTLTVNPKPSSGGGTSTGGSCSVSFNEKIVCSRYQTTCTGQNSTCGCLAYGTIPGSSRKYCKTWKSCDYLCYKDRKSYSYVTYYGKIIYDKGPCGTNGKRTVFKRCKVTRSKYCKSPKPTWTELISTYTESC